ncbi:MAG TPA: hypothetical protein VHQ95_11040, partial [Pyrinomonadaceae bacterium]|nr:hypothetical protein [Pyrinomonadaceae bacterium]
DRFQFGSMAFYREAVSAQSPGLPRFAATQGIVQRRAATLTGLRLVITRYPMVAEASTLGLKVSTASRCR